MPDPGTLRDSTQIVLPAGALDGHREDVEEKFTVTIVEAEERLRIVGSPVVIKECSEYLARLGLSVP